MNYSIPDIEIPNTGQLNPYLVDRNYAGFYTSYSWKKKRREVMTIDRGECQVCKDKGKYTKATDVHHIFKIRERPDLALEIYVTDAEGNEHRNLVAVCSRCHDMLDEKKRNEPLIPEWDGE